jgi:hypothetical protein
MAAVEYRENERVNMSAVRIIAPKTASPFSAFCQ